MSSQPNYLLSWNQSEKDIVGAIRRRLCDGLTESCPHLSFQVSINCCCEWSHQIACPIDYISISNLPTVSHHGLSGDIPDPLTPHTRHLNSSREFLIRIGFLYLHFVEAITDDRHSTREIVKQQSRQQISIFVYLETISIFVSRFLDSKCLYAISVPGPVFRLK